MKNLIEILFDCLDINYTHSYITKLYNEHPHKYNMYGLYDILHEYNINAIGVKIDDKDYSKLKLPCILHINGGFVVVTQLTKQVISYYWNGRFFTLPFDKFNTMWTGHSILINGDSNASEPNYAIHVQEERIKKVKKHFPIIIFVALLSMGLLYNFRDFNLVTVLYALLDILGLTSCYSLIKKQLHIESPLGDSICSIFHQKDCNKVIFSEKGNLLGFSWSEIGFSYFITHILFTILYPQSVQNLFMIGFSALIYSMWSIYYQWRIVKQWCILCLIIQFIIIAMACLSYFNIETYNICTYSLLFDSFIFCIFWSMILSILNLYIQNNNNDEKMSEYIQKYKAIKANTDVFQALLKKEKYNHTTENDSMIIFGNKDAKTKITILTNPHCNPCAQAHEKIDNILKKYREEVCIQYIFSSFTEELKESNRFLIAIWEQLGEEQASFIFSQWFKQGKNNVRKFKNKWKELDINSSFVQKELKKHEEWKQRTGYNATPTILVNGYYLPEEYLIEDIPLFIELND